MKIEEMQNRKKELGYTYAKIAELAGLPLPTVQKVLGGATKSPRYSTILALEKVLAQDPSAAGAPDHHPDAPYPGAGTYDQSFLAGEASPVYASDSSAEDAYSPGSRRPHARRRQDSYPLLPHKSQGEYTWEDREMLPQDVRTELIDGIIYDLASPKADHQITLLELSYQLRTQIDQFGRDCMVFVAPSDVWLTPDNRNIFQPDIYVICDYSMIDEDGYTRGAPPFVIEILSPSTRSKDLLLKSYKYHAAGVHEYWIVDPEKKRVTVYDYDRDPEGTENTVYTFDQTIPVACSGGQCKVSFSSIAAALAKIGK